MRDARPLSAVDSLSVAYFCPGWPPESVANGVVMYVNDITGGMRALGHRPCILANFVVGGGDGDREVDDLGRACPEPGPIRRPVERLARRVARGRYLEGQTRRTLVAAVRRAVVERGVQVLEMEETFGLASGVRRRVPVPVVVRLHGPWFLNGPATGARRDAAFRRRVRLEGRAIAEADAVTASSADVLERTRAFYGLPLADAEVIHPPIAPVGDGEVWDPGASEPGLLLFVGRFDRHKGGDIALEAFGLVSARHPGARLLFVGPDRGVVDDDGRSWSFDEYLRAKLPASAGGRVEYLGQRPAAELPALRRRAAVTLVASRYDNFPTTVTEALARGCPLVATRAGGIPEVVEDGEGGLLCRPGDAGDLAGALARLLDDPALAARLGDRARRSCAGRSDPTALAARTADVYRRAIARRGGGRA